MGTALTPARGRVRAITAMAGAALGDPRSRAARGAPTAMSRPSTQAEATARVTTVGAPRAARSSSSRIRAADTPISLTLTTMVCTTRATAKTPKSRGTRMRAMTTPMANCAARPMATSRVVQTAPRRIRSGS